MIVIKIIVFIFFWFIFQKMIEQIKISGMIKKMRFLLSRIKNDFRRIYRILNVKKSSHYAWIELLKYHKSSGWRYGQFENEKYIECSFKVDETNCVDFNYAVNSGKLVFRSTILSRFDEEATNDILVLASHFNGLLNFGSVKVSVKYNYVEFVYSRDLLTYSLFPGEINSDTDAHFDLTKDCFWTFNNLIESGEDPVFVFSELLKRNDEESNADN